MIRWSSLFLVAATAALALGSLGCNTLTRPDEIAIAPEPKRAAPPPTPAAAAPAAAAPHAPSPNPGAPPGGG
jgi:hypothetical protein